MVCRAPVSSSVRKSRWEDERVCGDEGTGDRRAGEELAREVLADRLRGLREGSGRTYAALAQRIGVSGSTLHRYCTGRTVPAEFAPVERLARLCGRTAEERQTLHRLWLRADAEREERQEAAAMAPAAEAGAGGEGGEGEAAVGPAAGQGRRNRRRSLPPEPGEPRRRQSPRPSKPEEPRRGQSPRPPRPVGTRTWARARTRRIGRPPAVPFRPPPLTYTATSTSPRPRPRRLAPSLYAGGCRLSKVFLVTGRTVRCDCDWVAELRWSGGGRSGTVLIDDGGRPFRTSGAPGRSVHDYDFAARRWVAGPQGADGSPGPG
ncbi:helix-turn-helix transcriptional regulator [Streptomyces sp. NPDC006261]|uniref:helix-turn-helix domain-containing protein n=1 Tax=Streptomyces sp. NPDC006261 TaxID=3156739 RepID=UPI0033B5812C